MRRLSEIAETRTTLLWFEGKMYWKKGKPDPIPVKIVKTTLEILVLRMMDLNLCSGVVLEKENPL